MSSQPLIKRKDAQEKGLTRYFTGKACPKGHIAERLVSNKGCVICVKNVTNKWFKNNPEKKKRYDKTQYYKKTPEKRRADWNNWANHNKEHLIEYCRDYRSKNRDRLLEYQRSWFKLNPHAGSFYSNKRRALLLSATPSWANLDVITEVYKKCYELSKQTGILHHVDHIVPLQNKLVCGLHVEWNLQIITAEENLRKNNKFEVL